MTTACPQCGHARPPGTPCPRCLLGLGLSGGAGAAFGLPAGARLGPYEVVAPLGSGGMGEVYRALDPRLEREVAIKVLPEATAESRDALARFALEAKAIAAVSHPNILAVHDFGNDGGIAFVVTELLVGETLRELLARQPLAAASALEYGIQIAQGLAAAHAAGIVHRDVKPENVFVTVDGRLKLLDFGLAKLDTRSALGSSGAARRSAARGATAPGTVLGTVGYMSPEQVRGEPADARSDIFSFGATLYEMLWGQPAFEADSAVETMHAILTAQPPPRPRSGRQFAAPVESLVERCLEKQPQARFQSALELVRELRGAVAAAASHGAAPLADSAPPPDAAPADAAPAVPAEPALRVAVLPFENQGPRSREHVVDGIADEVRGKLTLLPGLQVIARGSSMPYKGFAKTPSAIARELEVTHLLSATVRWSKSSDAHRPPGDRSTGSRVTVAVELVEVKAHGMPLAKWQRSFDSPATDLFALPSEIAARAAEALGVTLGAGEYRGLGESTTQSLEAYEAFHRAEEASNSLAASDPESLRRAIASYEQAVALDPGFAAAWSQLARASALDFFVGTPSPRLAARARAAAERAMALAPEHARSHLALGDVERWVASDSARALELYIQGWRRAPGDSELLSAAALAEQGLGRWEEAVHFLHQAQRVDPRSVPSLRRLAYGYLCLRRYAEARDAIERGLRVAPTNLALLVYSAMKPLGEGHLDAAREALAAGAERAGRPALVAYAATYGDLVWALDADQQDLLVRLTPSAFDGDRGVWGLCLAQAHALRGNAPAVAEHAAEARLAFTDQIAAAPTDPRPRLKLGQALALLGRAEEGVEEGERATALLPIEKDAYSGPYLRHQLARIKLLAGRPEDALDDLAALLAIPYYLSPGWLRIDPGFAALRDHPRFRRLAGLPV